MRLKTLVAAVLVGALAPFARGAVTVTSPADYATVETHGSHLKAFEALTQAQRESTSYLGAINTTWRKDAEAAYNVNSLPITLSWSGTSGSTKVTVTCNKTGKVVFEKTTTAKTVEMQNYEIGRNYTWTISNTAGNATGHFYVGRSAPRIIPLDLCHASAARDCGGWKAESGKVVKQGKVFRTAAFDWVYDEATMLVEFKDYWNNVVGLKTEIDLREEKYWKLFQQTYGWEGSTFGLSVRLWCSQTELGTSYKSGSYASAITDANMRTAMKGALLLFADAANYPILFHCSQGRDRTGTLAFVLNGMLGVSLDDLYLDYDYTDYSKDEYTGPTASNGWITKLYNQLKTSYPDASYPTLQSKCVAYAKKCGLTDDNIASIKANLLEPAEAAAGSSEEPTLMEEHDEVTYRPYWWFRDAGGGTWTSSGGYFYTDETATKKCKDVYGSADGVRYPDAYDALVVMKPNAKYPYCGPSCAAYKIGKLITNGTGGEVALGNPKFTFQNQSVSTRTLWRHEAGHAAAGNTDLTLDGTGTGSIDLYKGAIIDASDLVAKTPNTIFLKFAPKSDGAGMTVVPHSSNKLPTTKLGWFEGGSATDTQRFEVSNAWLRFANASKTCQVAGALDFNFILGPSNKTTTAFAPFGVSGSLVINAGSRLTVDAGEKSAGTYPLITVGSGKTLTCDASLCSNATVTGLKSGTTGAVVKSGNQINLVIANASGKTVVTVPAISATSATYTGTVQKPTFSPSSSNYTVNYGSGDYKAVGTYTITLSLVNTTSYVWGDGTTAAKTYSYEIKSGSDPGPEPGPTPDTKAVTYTWKGGTGLWSESANWTPGTGATYGIPDNATYATADFPATLTAATTCTLASDAAVKYALFNAPNLTLVLDNATLTCNDRIDMITWGAFNFGNTKTGNSTIEFKGVRAAMVTTLTSVRANFGYLGDDTASGTCTMRFVVPATGWETTAPIRTGADSKVVIHPNVKLAVNATALGVPAEGVTKTVLLASSTDGMFYSGTATVTCANGASGEVVVEGNDLVLKVTGGGPVQPEPEPTPSAKFDAAHTIVCYGDSLTWGTAAAEITMDDRPNFFEGRLAGVAEMPQSYPYWLSGMIPSSYNVIQQARAGSQTCNITSWSGEQTVKVKTAFTLPAVGSVSLCKNLVFGSDCSYGEQGGWAKGEPDDQDVQDRWYGFVTPIFSLYEPYDAVKTRYSITGTLGGRHVRLQGLHPTNVTVTVFGEGTAETVAAGSEFVPDNELVSPYKDAIRVICTGANDGDKNYAAEIKPHLQEFAAKGGRYLIVSPSVNTGSASGTNATATENDMATTFGENYLNLRLKMVTEGKARAAALGVPFTGNWDATDGTGLKAVGDSTHFSEKGYKVMADFIREKLVALGYIEGEEPPPVEMTDYYYSKTQVAGVYQSTKTWYKNAACSTGWGAYPNGYDAAVHFAPNAGVSQIVVLDDWLNAKTGEVTFDGPASLRYGSQTFENNALTPKPVWTVRSGEADGVCLTLALTGSGSGYVDILGGASAAFTSSTLSDKLSIRFNPTDCANSALRFDGWDGEGTTTFAALTGGAVGTTQTLTVSNCWTVATSTTVASGVAGALAIKIMLGERNTTSSDAPLQFAGTFAVAAGSTLTVDATGKEAGTYPLLAAGTLSDAADLAASAAVIGVVSGFNGTVIRNGNRLDLVITGVTPPGPLPGGLTTNAMANASWGYEIRGLGAEGNEVALVYTNPAPETAMTWPVPTGVTSFDFLVVGGGGGGGGTGGANAGGGGGGAGAVRSGTVAVSGGESCAVVVGKGGAAGAGALKSGGTATVGGTGGTSSIALGASLYDALGGGGGGKNTSNGLDGGCAGGGGSKTGVSGSVLLSSDHNAYGNVGGSGATIVLSNYTYPGAGGGGAALDDSGKGGSPVKLSGTEAKAGDGGAGVVSAITGEEIAYGGGGGGGASKNDGVCTPGAGGLGGGGVGYWKSNQPAGKGVDGLGGGGGGAGNASWGTNGARGGSGVVVIRYALGSAEDPIPEEIKTGKSGDVITVPAGATVDVSDPTKLVVNGKEYAVKDHYVFVAKEAGVVLEIAPDEAVIADISIAADGTVTVTSDKAFELFCYALESADNLGFENATTTAFQALDASKTLSVKKDGETRFYRLVVRD